MLGYVSLLPKVNSLHHCQRVTRMRSRVKGASLEGVWEVREVVDSTVLDIKSSQTGCLFWCRLADLHITPEVMLRREPKLLAYKHIWTSSNPKCSMDMEYLHTHTHIYIYIHIFTIKLSQHGASGIFSDLQYQLPCESIEVDGYVSCRQLAPAGQVETSPAQRLTHSTSIRFPFFVTWFWWHLGASCGDFHIFNMDVSKNRGTPKWMVF